MNLGQKATASYPGALFDLDDDKPSKDPLSELLKEILKVERNYDRDKVIKTMAA
jgi:hypothetical protein